MSAKVYKVNTINEGRVYLPTKKSLFVWLTNNPGECKNYEVRDAWEEIIRLQEELEASERQYELASRRLQEL